MTRPGHHTTSNTEISTEEWSFTFLEMRDPALPTEDKPLRQALSGSAVRSFSAEGRDKWLYVFLATLDDAGTIVRTALQFEGQYDDQGVLRTVDWRRPDGISASEPHPLSAQDVRPATDVQSGNAIVLLIRSDGSSEETPSGTARPDSGRTAYLAFLSHVQLTAARLANYFGSGADALLRHRSLLLDPITLAPTPPSTPAEGAGVTAASTPTVAGYGPDADGALRGEGGAQFWVQVPERSGPERKRAKAYLLDYVDWADQLHQKYEGALEPLLEYDLQNAPKLFHATITRSVAQAYADAETDGNLDDVPGRPLDKIRAFEQERQPLALELTQWSQVLYQTHMRLPGYRLARADGAELKGVDQPSEAQYERIEDEAERQLQLLGGAELSEAGKAYLVNEVADVSSSGWLVLFAKLDKLAAKTAAIPVALLKYAHKAPWAERKKLVTRTIPGLQDRRIGLVADLVKTLEHARIQRDLAVTTAAQLRGLQAT